MKKTKTKIKVNPYEALAELCRRSFYRFLQEFWSVVIPEEPVYGWHMEYLCDELQYLNSFVVKREPKPYDLVINVPPGSSKSTIVLQMYNAWVWTIDPTQRFITSSYSGSLSLSHSMKTRDILASPKYRKLFPNVFLKADQSAKSDFRNSKGGQRFTTSTKATVTGVHAHQILIDDPLNAQGANSDAEREAAGEHLKTLSSRKVNKDVTPTILVMQRLHEKDPAGIMLSKRNKKIKHICLPSELSDIVSPPELKAKYVDGLLDPIRLNHEVLAEAREDLGSYGYAGQHGQNPAPAEGGIFKKHWFEVVDWKAEHERLYWNFAADTAYTKDSKGNDPSGYIAYAKYGSDILIRGAQLDYLEFPELCKALPSFIQQNGYSHRSIVEVEPKASGKSLVQTLKKETALNIKEGIAPSTDKVTRAHNASPTVEAGRVKIIRGNWNEAFLQQVCTFPNAEHDEFVDCLTMIIPRQTKVKKKTGVKRTN